MTSRLLPAIIAEPIAPVREREGWPDTSGRPAGDAPASWPELLRRCESAGPAPLPGASDRPDLHRLTHGGAAVWVESSAGDIGCIGAWLRERVRSGATARLVAPLAEDRAALREDFDRRGVPLLDLSPDAGPFSAERWLGRWASLWDRSVRQAAMKAADPSTRLARWKADSSRLLQVEADLESSAEELGPAEADLGARRRRAELVSEIDELRMHLDAPATVNLRPLPWWKRLLGIEAAKPADREAQGLRLAELERARAELPESLGDDPAAEAKTSALRQAVRGLQARRDEILGEWFDGPLPTPLDERARRWAALGTDLAQQTDARRKTAEERFDALVFDPPEWMASGLSDAPVALADGPGHSRLRPGDYVVVFGPDRLSADDLLRAAGLGLSLVLVGPRPQDGPGAELLAALQKHPWSRCADGWRVELSPCAAPAWERVADRPEIQLGVDPGPGGGLAAVTFSAWGCPWAAWAWLSEEAGSAPLPPCPADARLVSTHGRPALIWDESAENPDWKPVAGTPVEVGRNDRGEAVGLRFPGEWDRSEAAEWLRDVGQLRPARVIGCP